VVSHDPPTDGELEESMNAATPVSNEARTEADETAVSPLSLGRGALAILVGAAYLLFIVGPPLLATPIGFFPSLRTGDVLDLVTPLVVIPLAGLFFLAASPRPPSRLAVVSFVVASVVWVEGQAIHLAANAIGHHVPADDSPLSSLVAYLDEDLSHQLWHGSVAVIAAMTMYRAALGPTSRVPAGTVAAVILGGVLFGLTYFLMVVEGRTAGAALPVAAAMAIAGLVTARAAVLARPALGFYVVGFVVSLGLAFIWASLNDWRLVEFSEVFGF
jgi:hypothetical protein